MAFKWIFLSNGEKHISLYERINLFRVISF